MLNQQQQQQQQKSIQYVKCSFINLKTKDCSRFFRVIYIDEKQVVHTHRVGTCGSRIVAD